MMHKVIIATLITDAKLWLSPYWNDYTTNKQVYAPLFYNTIMRLVIIDNSVTDQ